MFKQLVVRSYQMAHVNAVKIAFDSIFVLPKAMLYFFEFFFFFLFEKHNIRKGTFKNLKLETKIMYFYEPKNMI